MIEQLKEQYGKEAASAITEAASSILALAQTREHWFRGGWLSQEGGHNSALFNCITYILLRLEQAETLEDACYNGKGDYLRYLNHTYGANVGENMHSSLEDTLPDSEEITRFQEKLSLPSAEEEYISSLSLIEGPEESMEDMHKNQFPFPQGNWYAQVSRREIEALFVRRPTYAMYFLEYARRGGTPNRRMQGIIGEMAEWYGVSYHAIAEGIRVMRKELSRLVT